METGLLPNDEKLVGEMIKDICLRNAVNYFRLPQRPFHPEGASISAEARSKAQGRVPEQGHF
jgi:hypothetical protein